MVISTITLLPLKWYLIDVLFTKVHSKPMPLPLLIIALTLNIAFPKIIKVFLGHYISLILSCLLVLWATEMLHPNIFIIYFIESVILSIVGDILIDIVPKIKNKLKKYLTHHK